MAGRAPLRALTGRRRSCTARFATSIVWPMMEPFFESNSAHPVGKRSLLWRFRNGEHFYRSALPATADRAASPAMCSSRAASLTTASYCRACAQGKKDERYCFVVDWFDPQASLVRKYQLIYYSADGTIEMVRSCARTLQILAGWPCVADASVPISSARHAALRRLCRDAAVGLLPATCCLLPASCCL